MWLEDPSIITSDEYLKSRTLVFDYHESALDVKEFADLDFVNIKIFTEKGRASGTSLFYEYLIKENLISDNFAISEFVELTRLYDTWEWITIKNEKRARDLTTLFNAVGANAYIKLMSNKLKMYPDIFTFSELESNLIAAKDEQILKQLQAYASKIYYKEVMNLKAGIIFIDYEYRNDLAQYLRDIHIDSDFVMLIALDNGTISYRNITPGVKVLAIAEAYGGKGHDYAASSPIKNDTINDIIDILTLKKD